ncbi:relaxase/mobilization nuclease domain-containing protein [Alteromonas sp. a30]|uniref:relaxase/mobilization nuclease domain-containing protein n=1 Tax=Alteromonas sp. a30 TaxID=2730917 RepID=UPI002280C4A7|nr:relaxase/mobilization nuclease domain-containing protein [Alteromonas sp. a30]MCY7297393.1 relaxase/mobilization nuclease domain-containing protein [Alteromonas sp. a30]
MILKANQRGGARQLAAHLTSYENDHVDVLKIEGFCQQNLDGALQEAYAVSRATQCKKFLFSLVISPPEKETVNNEAVFDAAKRALEKVGLKNQPHIVVAHEKEGRRHFHVVASRIDNQTMKAIKLPYYKQRLNDLSRDLFLENGWDLPKGFKTGYQADPRNFTLAEWQQAKRLGLHPKQIKGAIKKSWEQSDNRASFKAALGEAGCFLARGDRRNGFVAVSWQGEIYPLNKRNLGATAKDIRAKLGEPATAQSITEIKAIVARERYGIHKRLRREQALKHKLERQPLTEQKRQMIAQQRQERSDLATGQQTRSAQENQKRLKRLRKGLGGLFDFVTGRSRKQKQKNEAEARACIARDLKEKEALIQQHIHDRQALQKELVTLREKQQAETIALNASFVQQSQGIALKGKLKREFERINQHTAAQQHKPNLEL